MKKRVIIIGAGIAGISSAIELVQNDIEVIVLERRAFPGGRMYSIWDNESGEYIDNGQHLMAGAYVNFFRILKTLGTYNLIEFQKSLIVPFIDLEGNSTVLDSNVFPGKMGILYGFMKFSGVCYKSKIKSISLIRNMLNDKIEIEGMTVDSLLSLNKIPGDIIDRFWKPFCLAVMNLKINDASAQILSNVLKKLFQSKNNSSLAFSNVPLLKLISPITDWLSNKNSNIYYNSTVKQLQIDDNQIAVITDKNEIIIADAIISALPYFAFQKILPEKYREYLFFKTLNEYKNSSIISIYLWLDKEISNANFTGMLGTKTQWIFNRRLICHDDEKNDRKYPGHITLTISGANDIIDENPEMLAKECFNEVKTAFKSDAKLLSWKVIKEKRATFISNPLMDAQRLSQQTPIANLFIAGDWTSTGLPATLEGAAYSGVLAAEYAMNYLNEK
ncbi:MAG: FAD-dependent oxidoreductase [Ignavibacteriae bacterium]|nr:FAD-dependent oxidoreductase [Ignavibacteriota bacterium]